MKIRRYLTRQICRADGKSLLDYVTRRFNASSAGLKKPVGLNLRWDRRFTRSPNPTGAPSQHAKANLDILVKEIAEAPSVRNGAQADENVQKLSLELEVHCFIPAEPWALNQQRHGAWADSLPLGTRGMSNFIAAAGIRVFCS
jgi:hypothetical protein